MQVRKKKLNLHLPLCQRSVTAVILLKSTCSYRGAVNDKDLAETIAGWVQYALVYVAMTDYPAASNFLSSLPAYPVKKVNLTEAI